MTVWDRQAENCCQYLKKGSAVHVEGSLKMDTWDDKTTGEKRSKIKVQAERVQFLDRRDESGRRRWRARPTTRPAPPPTPRRPAPGRRPASPRPARPGPETVPRAGSQPAARRTRGRDDEDIPF